MTLWSALPAWMRRVPVVGWLAAALVAVVLLYLRARRQAEAARVHAEAVATAARARRRLADVEHEAAEVHRVETQAIRQQVAEAQDRADTARAEVARLSGQGLADEWNRSMGRRK